MANDGVDYQELLPGDVDDSDANDNLCYIDIDTVMNVLDEDCDPSESSPMDSSLKNVSPGESGIQDNFQVQSGSQVLHEPLFSQFELADVDLVMGCSPFCSDVSDSGARGSVGLSDSATNSMLDCEHENQGPPSQACSSPGVFPCSYMDPFSLVRSNEICNSKSAGVSKCKIPAYSAEASCAEGHSNKISVYGDSLNMTLWQVENETQFKHVGEDVESEHASHSSIIENGDVSLEEYEPSFQKMIAGISWQQENDSCTSFEISVMDADSHVATSNDSTLCQVSHVPSDVGDCYLPLNHYQSTDCKPYFASDSCLGYFPNGFGSQYWTNEEIMSKMKAEKVELNAEMACMSSSMHSSSTGGTSLQDSQYVLEGSYHPLVFDHNALFEDKGFMQLHTCASYMSHGDPSFWVKGEGDELITPYQNNFHDDDTKFDVRQDGKQLPRIFPSRGCQNSELLKCEEHYTVNTSERSSHCQDIIGGTASIFSSLVQDEGVDSHPSKGTSDNCHVEDDSDVCIIEDISHPAPLSQSSDFGNSVNISHSSMYADSTPYMGTRLKACDERNILLQVALQDLSQPQSEVSPPDGLLAVPLLRHQRIALSWMVQKETSSLYCSGGILADDQGLGKTVSTIALILKERRPIILCGFSNAIKGELETLNLDADDDKLPEDGGVKKESNTCRDMSNRDPIKSINLLKQTKGRPSAGTLIVCPTSVLRQWAEELHDKVTSQANLSVLVYHGSNRTKDPNEVAKYDVVLTTYSIVSMEVPKQPLVDKDDEEKGMFEGNAVPTRKRKCPPNSNRSGKKGLDSTMLEAVALPLAKVAWFRVVLDEAQSIKNHKTQVARACWGLRAKRRWCLSGTPIQNAIDDLYSYFRFLRYDPYAVYTSFCSTIKNPISRNPTKGYIMLQAVLKTIMLRRTKGTLLDGKPIISLPPKSVELKKVDFSREERDFYSSLEADSRAQFQEYANAGTVKQNYVNILLMLLRLRQACDHPLLVKHYNSNSLWRSSLETAKKLPQEKQIYLLKCLEGSLALCGICNDPPEDAVVSACGHVFCNQCICEHVTGDDNQCPATNCKTQLSMSSVFSKATLNCCLSDQACDNLPGFSGSEVEKFELYSLSQPYKSSKIKAALEVLHSLCKLQQCHTPKNISGQSTFRESNDCPGNSADANNGKYFKDIPETQNSSGMRSSIETVTVVGEKAIVFSQWTRMLDLLEGCLKNSSIQYRRLDGTMSVVARDKAVKDFNTLPKVSVMIMSLKAASLGLNMVAACHVLMLDLWWNPTTEDQAIDRAHRIGQTRPVSVLRLTVRDTVEDRILALQEKKRKLVSSAFGEDGRGSRQSRLTVDDLKYLFMM